jgi:hypothetical protein
MKLVVEIIMNKKKWLLIGAYKPPTVPENIFTSDFIKCLHQVTCNYDKIHFFSFYRLLSVAPPHRSPTNVV